MSKTAARLQTPPGRGGIAIIELTGERAAEVLGEVFSPWPSHRQDNSKTNSHHITSNIDGGDNRGGRSSGNSDKNCGKYNNTSPLRLGDLISRKGKVDQAIVLTSPSRCEINIHGGPQAALATLELLRDHGVEIISPSASAGDSLAKTHPKWNNPAIAEEMLQALPGVCSPLVASALTCQWCGGLSELARSILDQLACQNGPTGASAAASQAALARHCRLAAGLLTTMRRLLQPCQVVLIGPPNVGKSTLANYLTGRTMSIVHSRAGTTRDWVREIALLNGVPIYLTDTAGLWDKARGVDAQAIIRAHSQASRADLIVLITAGCDAEIQIPPAWRDVKILHVSNKCDQIRPSPTAQLAISALTGEGIEQLGLEICSALKLAEIDQMAPMAFTQRQCDLLITAASALETARLAEAREALQLLLSQAP